MTSSPSLASVLVPRLIAGFGLIAATLIVSGVAMPLFGHFEPASARGLTCEWDVPAEAFMVSVLNEAATAGVSGPAKDRDEFTIVT